MLSPGGVSRGTPPFLYSPLRDKLFTRATIPSSLIPWSTNMKYRATIFASLLFVLLGCFASTVNGQGHTIRGKIRNSLGANVGRVAVSLEKNGALVDQTV